MVLAKRLLIDDLWDTVFVLEDYHQGTCCGKGSEDGYTLIEKPVRNVMFGRLQGIEVCDECIEVERVFLQSLYNFDATAKFDFDGGEDFNEAREQNRAFEELKQKHRMTMEEKRRREWESLGQQRLF